MSSSERSDARPDAASLGDDDDLGFDVGFAADDDEIDWNLADWPKDVESGQVSDTDASLPVKDTERGAAESVRAEDLGNLDGLLSGLDLDFDLDASEPAAVARAETPPKKTSPRKVASGKSASAAGERTPPPPSGLAASSASRDEALMERESAPAAHAPPWAAADPPAPSDDPGYDVLPAAAPIAVKRPASWRTWLAVAAGTALLSGLAWLGASFFGDAFGTANEPDAYAAIRARAASRARSNPDAAAPRPPSPGPTTAPPAGGPTDASQPVADAAQVIEIGVAYGTEKRNWLEWATQEFAHGEAGQRIRVRLIPMGSLESAHAILDGDQRIHVWSPASSLYRETLLREWEAKFQGTPILKEEALALTPMVLVMWKGRYDAFTVKSPTVSLRTIGFAMRAQHGWTTIAGRTAWGRFKFGHTHPNQSNSGLMTLIVLAYEFFGKQSGLTVSEIMSQPFQDYLTAFRAGVAGVSHSTGTLMKEMALKGPTSYDALMVYENLAIEYAKSAEGRWDSLQVIYPEHNLWNENPYCILNTAWTTPEHQQAAQTFLAFLLSEPIQARALDFGFRPANPHVPVKGPDSPFTRYAKYGLSIDLPATCEVPSCEVLENLQHSWIRCAPPARDGSR